MRVCECGLYTLSFWSSINQNRKFVNLDMCSNYNNTITNKNCHVTHKSRLKLISRLATYMCSEKRIFFFMYIYSTDSMFQLHFLVTKYQFWLNDMH